MSQNTNKFKMSFIVPVYNEKRNLANMIVTIDEFANGFSLIKDFELVIVDDGSNDGSNHVLTALLHRFKNVRVVHYKQNRGKGYAVKQGLIKSKHPIKIILDADLSVLPHELEKYVPSLRWAFSEPYPCSFVGRRRYSKKQPLKRRVAGKLFGLLANTITGVEITDTQCLYGKEQLIFKGSRGEIKVDNMRNAFKYYTKHKKIKAMTLRKHKGRYVFVSVKNFFRKKVNENLLKIKLNYGKELNVTNDHPIFMSDKTLKLAKDLRVGDELYDIKTLNLDLPNKYKEIDVTSFYDKKEYRKIHDKIILKNGRHLVNSKIKIDYDFMFMLGLFTSEGDIQGYKYCIRFSFSKKEKEYIEFIKNYFNSLGIPIGSYLVGNCIVLTVHSKIILNLFQRIGIKYQHTIPDFVFNVGVENAWAYIDGLFCGDGNIHQIKNSKNYVISITLRDYMLKKLNYLLSSVGIKCGMHFTRRICNITKKREGKLVLRKNQRLVILQKYHEEFINNTTYFSHKYDVNVIKEKSSKPRKNIIKKISHFNHKGYVYNLSLKKPDVFVCSDLILTHNCPFKVFVNFPESYWHTLIIDGFAYDVELIRDARRRDIPVVSIPVSYYDDPKSSVTMKKAIKMFFDLFKIAFKTKNSISAYHHHQRALKTVN